MRFLASIAAVLLLIACAAPVEDRTDVTSTTTQTEETPVESTTTSEADESSDDVTDSTSPELPVTTTRPEKKDGLPVPPDPTIPPPRD